MLVSNCCEARIIDETDLCSDCKEHCEEVTIPTTHLEKSVVLYGDVDMSVLAAEIPLLEKRIEMLEANKRVVLQETTATTYQQVTAILNAQKLFQNMIEEIKAYEKFLLTT